MRYKEKNVGWLLLLWALCRTVAVLMPLTPMRYVWIAKGVGFWALSESTLISVIQWAHRPGLTGTACLPWIYVSSLCHKKVIVISRRFSFSLVNIWTIGILASSIAYGSNIKEWNPQTLIVSSFEKLAVKYPWLYCLLKCPLSLLKMSLVTTVNRHL